MRIRILSLFAIFKVHSFHIVHGDLTSVSAHFINYSAYILISIQMNVLIDREERACLSDFGLSTIIEDVQGTTFLSSNLGGAVRWAAPELFSFPDEDTDTNVKLRLSTSSDMYSFGGIMFQACSPHQ